MTDDIPSLIVQLETLAKARGVGVPELCRLGDISRSTYTRWKSGAVLPQTKRLHRLIAAMKELPLREPWRRKPRCDKKRRA